MMDHPPVTHLDILKPHENHPCSVCPKRAVMRMWEGSEFLCAKHARARVRALSAQAIELAKAPP